MRILKTLTLRGPNYWSVRHPQLIVIRLDLEVFADQRSDQIDGLAEGLAEILPSLKTPGPSYRRRFLERVEEGISLAEVVEHVALELQTLADMPVSFGRTKETKTAGIHQVVFEYENEQSGRYAARAAVRLANSLAKTGGYPASELKQDLADLRDLQAEASLGPSTETIIQEVERRGIPWMPLQSRAMIQLGHGVYQQRLQATLSSRTGILGVELACDKEGTKQILKNAGVPVPRGTVIYYLDELADAIDRVGGFPIVIKPLDGNHGRGITIDINGWDQAEAAYEAAKDVSKGVIVERFYRGRDHRILVINGRVVAVAERVPAHVVGDGRSTIDELIEEANRDPRRGEGHANVLTLLTVDRTTWQLFENKGYDLDTVLPDGEICYLRSTANLSTGGIAIDRTDEIHPHNVWLAQRIAKLIGLDIAGIDVVTSDISQPLRQIDGVIVEVNAAPGFRMHFSPSEGIPRNVAEPVIEMLFPPGQPSRIPIVAITGTNGKTTTTRLTAHIFQQTQKVVGYTTTDGIYINEHLVEPGDTTGPQSAQVVLQDPTVEIAVLETARGGILRSGIAFDACDVGVVLNVAADHLGLGDIDTVEEMAQVKGVIAEVTRPKGYAVLNADDERVAAMAERTKAQIAYFSMQPDSELVQRHTEAGGLAAVYENGYLTILKGDWILRIEQAVHLPLTMGGRAPFMIANALAASLAAFSQGVSIEEIRLALLTFRASAAQTPGRMNLFDLGNFHALVDYAHNPASYEALAGFVQNWPGQRIGVIGGPGDRRDEDFITLGRLSAQMFDRVIVKEDDDTRGRPRGEAADYIIKGLETVGDCRYESILRESEAIEVALDSAPAGSLVVILPESVRQAIKLIEARNPVPQAPPSPAGSQPIATAPRPTAAVHADPSSPA
ncbi:cyanophycin synthetase [Romeria aff. gracilis LEGE 07310]|uniref:Cyanophycin synthetase n=1 Tax=Vasconcelosia minhoensis LEGE 07310 TaxID=915328 RepID=A0A8J7AXB5_9CYAN|nr:cyanophycin synthetase [Romeria gracilis]MBE9077742.1 cyanophycin synthetase [Romeria aff. gracilis LEGE 07310]